MTEFPLWTGDLPQNLVLVYYGFSFYYDRMKTWYNCREVWEQSYYYHQQKAFFVRHEQTGNNFSYHLKDIYSAEDKMQLSASDRCKCQSTVHDRLFYLDPGPFWCGNSVRFSVFTALFKNKYYYFNDPFRLEFLDLFLSGKNTPTKKYNGEYGFIANLYPDNFSCRPPSEILC
jgi:hypothetical protein